MFGVAQIFASLNDTFILVTDLSSRETLVRITGGMKVQVDRDESLPYAAMLAAPDVSLRCKELGITALHIKPHVTGGNKSKMPGSSLSCFAPHLNHESLDLQFLSLARHKLTGTGFVLFFCFYHCI